ncbi:MAG: 16S rRNA (cytosine(1402)-N(4))-methyltransferase RsmH [Candidatus Aphodomorpha sp.]
MSCYHVPVLYREVLEYLEPERGGIFVDGTLGGGGHASLVLERLPESGRLIGIDRDWEAVAASEERLRAYGPRFQAVHGNFFEMRTLLSGLGVQAVNGILLDLGVSSHQLDTPERGFSYHTDAPLDMRMDATAPLTARDVVNGYSFEALCRILRDYGEERFAPRIADRIVRTRQSAPIETTAELAALVCAAMPAKSRHEAQHPARRTFQAIRIEVNGELDGLRAAIDSAHDLLLPGGRLVMLTFHSLEDRIVKQAFRSYENPCICPPKAPVCVCGRTPTARVLTRKPLSCTEEEARANSRAICAKLRAIEKLP